MPGSADEALLFTCYQELTGSPPTSIAPLRPHASARRRYRIRGNGTSCIGVTNGTLAENDAFITFAKHFRACGLAVPETYLYHPHLNAYLEEDLGDTTLLEHLALERVRTGEEFPEQALKVYRSALEQLARFQIEAPQRPEFTSCLTRNDLTQNVLRPDIERFKREFVGRVAPDFDCRTLDDEFLSLMSLLSKARADFFMYRDFQARNIMLANGTAYFIDFQGGRGGPLQYDVVSLLYQTSARIPPQVRADLQQHYIAAAQRRTDLECEQFQKYYSAFIVHRMLEVLGVYGKQGLGEGKEYFRSSIPGALTTLIRELKASEFPLKLPKLLACAERLLNALPDNMQP